MMFRTIAIKRGIQPRFDTGGHVSHIGDLGSPKLIRDTYAAILHDSNVPKKSKTTREFLECYPHPSLGRAIDNAVCASFYKVKPPTIDGIRSSLMTDVLDSTHRPALTLLKITSNIPLKDLYIAANRWLDDGRNKIWLGSSGDHTKGNISSVEILRKAIDKIAKDEYIRADLKFLEKIDKIKASSDLLTTGHQIKGYVCTQVLASFAYVQVGSSFASSGCDQMYLDIKSEVESRLGRIIEFVTNRVKKVASRTSLLSDQTPFERILRGTIPALLKIGDSFGLYNTRQADLLAIVTLLTPPSLFQPQDEHIILHRLPLDDDSILSNIIIKHLRAAAK